MDTMPEAGEPSPLKRALLAIEDLKARLARSRETEPVAVIGMGCRLPGGVDGPGALWRMLMDGRDGIVEVPPGRWDPEAWYDADRAAPGKMNMRRAGFLTGGIDRFDATFFGIAPREAVGMDPQQRLLLEVAWEALEDAAWPPDGLDGADCGVFLGLYNNNYGLTGRGSPVPETIDGWSASGAHTSVAAGRLSFLLGLRGPSLAVDTACSSSLVAVHLAVRSLQSGECSMALAGGAHLLLAPEALVASTKLGATAPDGRCKTFDASADGFGHGEGCGLVVLKRLSDAEAQGDRVLAVIRGSAVNQDGRSNSLTAPNGPAQEEVVRRALDRAGIAPRLVGFVEAHGTGTRLGDPIEIEALAEVFGQARSTPLMVGSLKTNLGHLEAAAGIAGLIKAVLCAWHGTIPPHLNLTALNPEIEAPPDLLVVPDRPTPWEGIEGRRVAGVSAFGFGGTNAHVVLEAPAPVDEPAPEDDRTEVLPLSARTPGALADLAARWADRLERNDASLADLAFTAGAGRSHFAHRIAVTAADAKGAAAALRRAGTATPGTAPRVAFLFTGQGSQYAGMARRAYGTYPAFRDALDRHARILDRAMARPVLDVMFGGGSLDDTAVAQPLVVAVELALAALWRSWGVEPAAVMGHSVGEYAAAAVAGALTEEEALILVAERGRLMAALPAGGGMLAAMVPAETVEPLLSAAGGSLEIAALNGPANTVVSGGTDALDRLARLLSDAGIEGRRLAVSHAFHSALLDPVLPGLHAAAMAFGARRTRLRLVSNLSGGVLEEIGADHWRDHARRPVRFAAGLESLKVLGCDTFLEIGPQAVLTALGAGAIDGGRWIASLRRGLADDAALAEALAAFYRAGAQIDWAAVHAGKPRRKLAAPTYSFQRQRYWLDLPDAAARPSEPVTTAAEGSALVYDFYDELTVVSRTYNADDGTGNDIGGTEAEGHLTFGFLPEPVPGFSWVRALFEKDEDPAAHALFRATQRELKDSLFAGIDFSRMRHVFDYGCGHAADLCALALRHPHLRLQGYTISARQVQVGMQRAARLGLEDRVRVHRNDSSAVPFPGTFDLIFGFEVTGLIADKDLLFDNIAAHLAPGGLFVVADFVSTGDPIANPETNSFTPAYGQWVDLLSRRRLRLVRAVDASVEVANWLDDPAFERNVANLVACFGLGELTHRHLLSNGNIGRALRADLMRYLLLTAHHSPHEEEETLAASNDALLRGAVKYRDLPAARASEPWRRWIHAVEWTPAGPAQALPSPREIAPELAPAVERERAGLAAFAGTSVVLDRLSLDYTVAAFRALGCADVEEAARFPVAEPFRRLRDRLAAMMREAGLDRLCDRGDIDAQTAEALAHHPEAEAELSLLRRCGGALAEAMTGRVDPLQLLFPGGDATLAERLYEHSPFSRAVQRLAGEAVAALPRGRPLSVLEVGGGTGATTAHIAPHLPSGSRYLFTDLGASLVARAERKFAGSGLDFARFDVAQPPSGQGIATGAWNLVVAANVLHATPDLARTLGHVHDLLAPGGLLIMIENTGRLDWGDLTFGLTTGMWAFTDTGLRDHALLRQEQWHTLLPRCGFEAVEILTPGEPDRGGVSQQCVILARRAEARHWLLVGGPSAFAASLAGALAASGGRCTLAERAAGDAVPADVTDAVYLGALDAIDPSDQEKVLAPALDLVKALSAQVDPPRLALVTHGAQAAGGGLCPAQATLTGFGRTVMGELPDLRCRLVDLDPERPIPALAGTLAGELGLGTETEIAIRGEERLRPSLVRRVPVPAPEPSFDSDASYILTGAFGGLGPEVARWMADRGAGKLVLAGRGEPSGRTGDALDRLASAGVTVVPVRCDVTDRAQVRALVGAAQAAGPLKGVFHAAGTLSDGGIAWQEWDDFAAVLGAKVLGTMNLHDCTAELALDHFVLFSSAACLLGPSGQANHAAANGFLDAFAHWRRARGLPALAIDWGAWAEVGAAVRDGIEERVERSGLVHMGPAQALRALGWAMMATRQDQVAVVEADWGAYLKRFPAGGIPTLLSGLKPVLSAAAPPERPPAPEAGLRERLAAAAVGRRMDLLMDSIRTEAARIMRIDDPGDIDDARALRDAGLDSLMSVELRNALVARTGAKLPATLLFDHPSVASLARFLADGTFPDLFAFAPPEAADGEALEGLDTDDLSALLEAELGTIESVRA